MVHGGGKHLPSNRWQEGYSLPYHGQPNTYSELLKCVFIKVPFGMQCFFSGRMTGLTQCIGASSWDVHNAPSCPANKLSIDVHVSTTTPHGKAKQTTQQHPCVYLLWD